MFDNGSAIRRRARTRHSYRPLGGGFQVINSSTVPHARGRSIAALVAVVTTLIVLSASGCTSDHLDGGRQRGHPTKGESVWSPAPGQQMWIFGHRRECDDWRRAALVRAYTIECHQVRGDVWIGVYA